MVSTWQDQDLSAEPASIKFSEVRTRTQCFRIGTRSLSLSHLCFISYAVSQGGSGVSSFPNKSRGVALLKKKKKSSACCYSMLSLVVIYFYVSVFKMFLETYLSGK